MKVSKKCEYALKALMELTINYIHGIESTAIHDIAQRHRIPPRYLEQILLTLKKAGILESKRGVGGGYALSRTPEIVSLGEIINIMDGFMMPLSKNKNENKVVDQNMVSNSLNLIMKEVGREFVKIVNDISLREMADRTLDAIEQTKGIANYVI